MAKKFLVKMVSSAKLGILNDKFTNPEETVTALAVELAQNRPDDGERFYKALAKDGLSYICEIKRACYPEGEFISESEFDPAKIAAEYEKIGAEAISVMTEREFFFGHPKHLRDAADSTVIPILRRDFVIDPYQIYQSKILGASAVLLIAAILSAEKLREFILLARSLGMEALVEVQSKSEIAAAISSGARIIGINNKNRDTFEIDVYATAKLRPRVPRGVILVSDGGINSRAAISIIKSNELDAVILDESLLKAGDRREYLEWLRSANAFDPTSEY